MKRGPPTASKDIKSSTTYRGLGVETDYIHFFQKMG